MPQHRPNIEPSWDQHTPNIRPTKAQHSTYGYIWSYYALFIGTPKLTLRCGRLSSRSDQNKHQCRTWTVVSSHSCPWKSWKVIEVASNRVENISFLFERTRNSGLEPKICRHKLVLIGSFPAVADAGPFRLTASKVCKNHIGRELISLFLNLGRYFGMTSVTSF